MEKEPVVDRVVLACLPGGSVQIVTLQQAEDSNMIIIEELEDIHFEVSYEDEMSEWD